MAMATCHECTNPVSTEAAACPHCGAVEPAARTTEQLAAEEAKAKNAATLDRRFKLGCLGIFVGLPVLIGLLSWVVGDDDEGEGGSGSAAEAEYYCEEFVRDRLRAPSTADFSEVSGIGGGNVFTVRGKVDAQNGFGALLRSSFRLRGQVRPRGRVVEPGRAQRVGLKWTTWLLLHLPAPHPALKG